MVVPCIVSGVPEQKAADAHSDTYDLVYSVQLEDSVVMNFS